MIIQNWSFYIYIIETTLTCWTIGAGLFQKWAYVVAVPKHFGPAVSAAKGRA